MGLYSVDVMDIAKPVKTKKAAKAKAPVDTPAVEDVPAAEGTKVKKPRTEAQIVAAKKRSDAAKATRLEKKELTAKIKATEIELAQAIEKKNAKKAKGKKVVDEVEEAAPSVASASGKEHND